ncbi:MAG: CRISPR-associated protein Cas4 [Dehalococcoidales bacterium]|nr:CRISPR-associated protein Cas4 [Dehalococcoidales bacterium]
MYSEDDFVPISILQHVLFCKRRAALVLLENLWEDNISTAEGSVLHEHAHQVATDSRNTLIVVRSLWLRSFRLGICGKADVVEFQLLDGDCNNQGISLAGRPGLFRPFPVEYKRGRLRSELSFEVQLCAQGLCLEEMLGIEVVSGALYYGKTRRRKEIQFDKYLRDRTESAALSIHELLKSGVTPRVRYQKKCDYCSLSGQCLPKITGIRKSVTGYLAQAYREQEYETSP